MDQNETPKQVKDRASKVIRAASRQYGFPPDVERLLETVYPSFCFEFQRLFRGNVAPETARSAGITIALNILREAIAATTPPDEQSAVTRKAIGVMGAALLNASPEPDAVQ